VFNKDLFDLKALSIHSDPDLVVYRHARHLVTGALAALIGTENLRDASPIDY
jgi:hypothetical protein